MRASSNLEATEGVYDIRELSNDITHAGNIPLASNAFLDSFWPNGGLEWLNSIPMEFGNNASGTISFDEY